MLSSFVVFLCFFFFLPFLFSVVVSDLVSDYFLMSVEGAAAGASIFFSSAKVEPTKLRPIMTANIAARIVLIVISPPLDVCVAFGTIVLQGI